MTEELIRLEKCIAKSLLPPFAKGRMHPLFGKEGAGEIL